MGLSKVNVFIMTPYEQKTPCRQDLSDWSIRVFDCYMEPLKLCDFKNPVKAPCGHGEFLLPPGCYIAIGIRENNIKLGTTYPVMFQVCCDKMTCVKLAAVGRSYALSNAKLTVERLAREKLISLNQKQSALKSLDAILAKLPKDEFTF